MLQIHHLRKSYGAATILADINFLINPGEHIGLIGANGAGKSTILRCIVGQERPDSGTIALTPPALRIGYLPQALDAQDGKTIGEVIAGVQATLYAAEHALAQASEALAGAADMQAALDAYDTALTQFEALGGYERQQRAEQVLEGLDLGGIDQATPVALLSGGQKTRLGLATLLLSEPDLLLLDEPTNHLDVAALEWLERFVQSSPHAVLIVSHDREFLDRTATRILYLSGETRSIKSYSGNYSDFAETREQERAAQQAAWQDQQQYIHEVESDLRRVRGQAMNIQNGPKRGRDFYGRVSAKVARQARARERKLERYINDEERVEKPRASWSLKLDFGPPPPGGRAVLRLEDVAFDYAPRPGAPPLLSEVAFDIQHGERVALVGPNGAGKTTLLRLMAGALQPLGGQVRLGANIRLGVMAQEQETLDPARSVLEQVLRERAMSETEARSFLHFFLFGGDSVFRPVGACSLGERSRLQLALLVLRGCNLLLLDEPLNHLDIEAREHFEQALDAFEGTIIAVSHDRAFLRGFAERIVEVRGGHARLLEASYEDYTQSLD